ncbi:MAG TPA: alpha/beta fold hydrolase [Terriglobia bacterium]|nr:alpha/beta fold hydrolase [Terriglobia bacterium]
MVKKHKDTETQRHRERRHQRIFSAPFLCVFVSLCLCVSAEAQLFPKNRRDTGPKPKNIHGVVQDLRSQPLPGARVFLKDMKTNVVRALETDQNGEYKVFGLTPTVDYELYAEFKGKTSEKKFVSAFLNREDNVLNFQLDVAVIENSAGAAPSDQAIRLKTFDLVELHASFDLPVGVPAPIPAVLLLHGYGENRSVWKDFAEELLGRGWAVMTLDLRGHGESRSKNQRPIEASPDWRTNLHEFPVDLDPALDWLKSRARVDNKKIVVIGFDVGANLALIASGRFQEVRTVVAIKPNLDESLALAGSAQDFQPRSSLIVVPTQTEADRFKSAVKPPSRVLVSTQSGGTGQWIASKQLKDAIFQWLKETY